MSETLLVVDVCEHILRVHWASHGFYYFTQLGGGGLGASDADSTNPLGEAVPAKCPTCGHLCSVRLATAADIPPDLAAEALGLSAEDFEECDLPEAILRLDQTARRVRKAEQTKLGASKA